MKTKVIGLCKDCKNGKFLPGSCIYFPIGQKVKPTSFGCWKFKMNGIRF